MGTESLLRMHISRNLSSWWKVPNVFATADSVSLKSDHRLSDSNAGAISSITLYGRKPIHSSVGMRLIGHFTPLDSKEFSRIQRFNMHF